MQVPKISIIIPVYNVENYIGRCVRSLMEQSLEDLEFIFVNDCSTDGSINELNAVLNKYPSRTSQVKIITLDKNSGPSAARNKGIELAKGEYIAFCDSDDWVETNMYETLYIAAKKEMADIAICDIMTENHSLSQHYFVPSTEKSKIDFLKRYLKSTWTTVYNFIAVKKLFEEHNLQFPETISFCEDLNFTVHLYYFAQNITHVKQALYHYDRTRETSIVHRPNPQKKKDELKCCLELVDFFRSEGIENELEEGLSWRILNDKQDLVLDPERHAEFLSIYPKSSKHIFSCPWCNPKIKVMMWLLSHHMRCFLLPILKLRDIKFLTTK